MASQSSLSVLLFALFFLSYDASAAPDPLAKGLQRAPRFIPSTSRFPWANLLTSKSSSSSPSPGAQSTFRAGEIGRPKRASYDDQCKGAYDREIFEKLDRLCEDCYNLYRKAYISYECRKNCFQTVAYQHCVLSLLLPLVRYKYYANTLYSKSHSNLYEFKDYKVTKRQPYQIKWNNKR